MDNIGDISSIVNKIISDPSFAEMVGRVKGDGGVRSAEDVSRDMASKLPEVMAMLAPMLSGTDGDSTAKNDSGDSSADHDKKENGTVNEKDKNGIIQKKYDKDHAEKLLYAIKPYLSKNRCEIIDKCVSVMQLTDVVSAFGGLEGLLKLGDK